MMKFLAFTVLVACLSFFPAVFAVAEMDDNDGIDPKEIQEKVVATVGEKFSVEFLRNGDQLTQPTKGIPIEEELSSLRIELGITSASPFPPPREGATRPFLSIENHFDKALHVRALARRTGSVEYFDISAEVSLVPPGESSYKCWDFDTLIDEVVLFDFRLVDDLAGNTARSKPVHMGGVEFEVVAQSVWQRPREVYDEETTNIGFCIRNRTDKDMSFVLRDGLRLYLEPVDGSERIVGQISERFVHEPIRVAAGKCEMVALPVQLVHTRIGAVCLGLKSPSGWNWLTSDLGVGKYRLQIAYESHEEADDFWRGKIQTEPLEIEVAAGE